MADSEITSVHDIEKFIFAGKARFTLVSKKTQRRFTYRVNASKDGKVYFVSVMTGPDNESSYSYAGLVRKGKRVIERRGKVRVSEGARSFQTISWYLKNIGNENVEFHHDGKCGACGRALTVPESVQTGLGPVCAGRMPHDEIPDDCDPEERCRYEP